MECSSQSHEGNVSGVCIGVHGERRVDHKAEEGRVLGATITISGTYIILTQSALNRHIHILPAVCPLLSVVKHIYTVAAVYLQFSCKHPKLASRWKQ